MGVIAEKRLNLIKGLVKSLPHNSLRSLELALGLTNDAPLVQVRELISVELEFRSVKEAVFEPYLPLFSPRTDGLAGIEFPTWLLSNLWAALGKAETELYTQSRYALRGLRGDDPTPPVFFQLVDAGAVLCRDTPERILSKSPTQDDRDEVAEFANYLDLHRIMRNILAKLPEFMGRIDAEKAAALRLMFKDACDINPESGYRLLELLFANLDDGASIIKFVATVSDRPNDRFLASSELADFGERILDLVEERLATLKGAMGSRGRPCEDLAHAGVQVASSLAQLQAFSHYIELSREGPWGKRVATAHKLIAELVEAQLNGAERLFSDVLPMKSEKVYGRIKKDVPRLDRALKPEIVTQAKQAAAFIKSVRNVATSGGFASLHSKVVLALEEMLDAYFEELLAIANGTEPFDPETLLHYFEMVSDLMENLCSEEKGATARRRIASSDLLKPQSNVA